MITVLMIATIVLWLLLVAVLPTRFDSDCAFGMLFEKSFPFVFGSLYLGILTAVHGFSFFSMVFQSGDVINKEAVLFSEIGFIEKAAVIVSAIGVVLIVIVELFVRKRIGYCIRDVLTLASCFVVGYAFIKLLLFLKFRLILALLPIARALLIICFAFSVLLWFVPNGMIAAMNSEREARERRLIRQKPQDTSDNEDFFEATESVPTYVTDDDGNQYPVEMRGDYLVICGSFGEVSVRWEYAEGQPYFDLNGTRYFTH